jgi:hypothetical protein
MTLIEKIYSVFAVFFVFGLFTVLFLYPETRHFKILLPLGLVGVAVNIGLMFIVLRDAVFRKFPKPTSRYIWIAVILVFWPTVIYYLPKYGFKKR